jgi:uncharacterized BrkB/YihY/UPF0761 family membrane protein
LRLRHGMAQTKKGSAVEALTNILMGFPINFLLNMAILPHTWNNDHVVRSAFITGAVFTVVSFVRQVYIRRFFNSLKAKWNTTQEAAQ